MQYIYIYIAYILHYDQSHNLLFNACLPIFKKVSYELLVSKKYEENGLSFCIFQHVFYVLYSNPLSASRSTTTTQSTVVDPPPYSTDVNPVDSDPHGVQMGELYLNLLLFCLILSKHDLMSRNVKRTL